jgi:5-bromo-4-chloroindolyl phosphate hydrolysis protein
MPVVGMIFTFLVTVVGIAAWAAVTIVRTIVGRKDKPGQPNADPKLEAARKKFDAELRQLKSDAEARRRKGGARKAAWTLGAVGAGLMAFGLMMQLDLFPLIGVGSGILVGALVAWLGTLVNEQMDARQEDARPAIPVPQRMAIAAPQAQVQGLPSGRAELVQRLLGEAADALARLDATIPRLRLPESVAQVAQIVASGNRLMKAVADSPEQLATAQRVFTYYCPESVKVAEGLVALESSPRPDLERIQATQTVLKKLAALFDKTELELRHGDAQALDIDVRLLDQSLEADLKLIN